MKSAGAAAAVSCLSPKRASTIGVGLTISWIFSASDPSSFVMAVFKTEKTLRLNSSERQGSSSHFREVIDSGPLNSRSLEVSAWPRQHLSSSVFRGHLRSLLGSRVHRIRCKQYRSGWTGGSCAVVVMLRAGKPPRVYSLLRQLRSRTGKYHRKKPHSEA